MERKRIEKLVVILLIGILMPVSLFPFPIHADTITSSNINGISITLDEVTFIEYKQFIIDNVSTNVARNYYNYIAEIQFDKSYLGYININMQYTYQARNDTGLVTYNGTKLQKVFVNGDKAYMSFGFVANSNTDPLWYNSITYSLTNSDVIEYGLISDIQQIVNILEENQDIIDDIYTELQNILSNINISNNYLESISKIRQLNLPFESLNFVLNAMQVPNTEYVEYLNSYIGNYPVLKINTFGANTRGWITRLYARSYDDILMIIGTDSRINTISRFNEFFTITNGTIKSIEPIFSNYYRYDFYKIIFNRTGNVNDYVSLSANQTVNIIPVYFGFTDNNFSTEFALLFGLSNSFLDNIQIIANGTSQSSSASGSLDQFTSQFSDDANDLVTIEESFNNSMNSSLQNVNPTFNMGSSFLISANWVSQQFNRIVNNTPFSSLITFGLTLGLGLLIIGKVRK